MTKQERKERVEKFLRGPGVFPRGFASHPENGLARRALTDVLLRLPANLFEKVEQGTSFLFDSRRAKMAACSAEGVGNLVIIFARGLKSHSETGLSGLLIHELAHGFLTNGHPEHAADDLAKRWGFADLVAARKREGGA